MVTTKKIASSNDFFPAKKYRRRVCPFLKIHRGHLASVLVLARPPASTVIRITGLPIRGPCPFFLWNVIAPATEQPD
jgi:hypothetical protein